MLTKNINFKSFLIKSKNKNIKKIFYNLKKDYILGKEKMLISLSEDYKYGFRKKLIKKYKKFNNFRIIGMGGSILGAEAIYDFLKFKIKKKFIFINNLNPIIKKKEKKIKALNIIISKSGNTLETILNSNALVSNNKNVFITENKNSYLINLANSLKAEVFEHKNYIGGRYSVLSEVGMVPAYLMGLNILRFRKNLANHFKTENKKFLKDSSIMLANLFEDNKFKNLIFFNYVPKLHKFLYWSQQLIAESLGKKGKGFLPLISKAPKDNHSLLQLYLDGPKDKFFTFFNSSEKEKKFKVSKNIIPENMKFLKNKNLKFIINAQCDAVKNVFRLKKIPYRQITFSKKNEEELGEIFTFFALETILLSRLMNVNPFDQPAVEQVKTETKKILR